MRKLLRWILALAVVTALAVVAAIGVAWLTLKPTLPEVDTLQDVRLQVPLRIYDADQRLIGVFGEKRRDPVTIDEVPPQMVEAFIAGEDANFYDHPGVDWQGLTRAGWVLLTTGEKSVGGSTITQQLARNFFLSFEKTYVRKAKEIMLALEIEQQLDKEQILELYLNKIYLGNRAYGVGAAAEVYYGKSLNELTLAESAMIAAMPKAPSRINPINSPERALERRNYVLGRMRALEFITRGEYEQAAAERDDAFYHGATVEVSAPYFAEMVRAEMVERYGDAAYSAGLEVWTTLQGALQEAASDAVVRGLSAYDRRHGWRGPEARIELTPRDTIDDWQDALVPYRSLGGLVPGLVTEVDEQLAVIYLRTGQAVALDFEAASWARPFVSRNRVGAAPEHLGEVLAVGDVVRLRLDDEGEWILAQLPEVEAALVALEPDTGAIRALVGGFDFARSKFNRVTQSRRQPGSSFKPFIYSAALDSGFTTATLVNDAPIVFEDPALERVWKPQNFSQRFYGPTRLREALVNSRNLVSIRVLRDIGVDNARGYITAFGFDTDELPPNLTMALGTATVTPLSMARGYGVFANGGYVIEPWFIERVVDGDDVVVFEMEPPVLCERSCEAAESTPQEITDAGDDDPARFRPLTLDREPGDDVALDATELIAPNRQVDRELERSISAQNAYLVRSMMMDVIKRGTGRRALEIGRNDLAGKTGTTNDQRDAWFSGYNDHLVATVWVGFDNHEPLGRAEVGGRAALPIWVDFMAVALDGVPDQPPTMPDGLAMARIDPETGLLAPLEQPGAIMEVFEAGRLPAMGSAAQGASPDATPEEDPYDIY